MSRHLIAVPMVHDDAVMAVGWDPVLRTYYCEIEYPHGIRVPIAGDAEREIPNADWLAQILADDGIPVPPVLVARMRLEKLADTGINAPYLDWRSGEPVPIT